ncbi:MAG: amidohydrolase [Candidatus Bathyarchaeota archaeon]|nr:amidohydrolase [Candidatus Bathyarchaeota archaeon]
MQNVISHRLRRGDGSDSLPADLALLNANIHTLNPNQPHAQAVAIQQNSILKVGSNQEIEALISKDTKVLRLEGKTVVPGLIDTHIHVADFGRCLLWLDLTGAVSVADVQRLLREKAARMPVGGWIIGRGWNDARLCEHRYLTAVDLDVAVPDNPVILYHEAAFVCVANSQALTQAHVTKQTPTPTGGTIDRDSAGELTGVFRDSATNLIWQAVTEPTPDELADATSVALREVLKAGLTSVDWIILSEVELTLIKRLESEGKLPLRVNVIVPETCLKQAPTFHTKNPLRMRLGGVILFSDGYLDSKTAALAEPYSDEPSNSGKLYYNPQTLQNSVEAVLAAGLQPVIHAMGDKAIDITLSVIEATAKQRNIRFRIEQAALLNPTLLNRLKAQNAVVTIQPKVVTTEFAVWSASEHLGKARASWLHPLKTLLEAGVKVAGGSDCPMEPLSPLLGMQELVERPSSAEQQLSPLEALRLYTLDAAYASGEETQKGSIEEGKLADLTVLSSDPLTAETNKIKDIKVEMVIVDGEIMNVS